MGSLGCLEDTTKSVHLIVSNSSKAEMFVYDKLKAVCKATRESVFEVETKKDFMNMVELSSMIPYLADKWLFIVNYSKLKSLCKNYKTVFMSDTSVFLVKAKNYRDYKEFKELVPICNDMYLSYLRSREIYAIFKGYSLSDKQGKFIANSYGGEVDKLFELKEKLDNGLRIESNKDIVNAVGASGSTVQKVVLSLLKDMPKTEKGNNIVYRNRIKSMKGLLELYSPNTLKNFLLSSVKDILDIKILYSEGQIFKTLKDIPEVYDEKRLSRYTFCLERIENEIPFSRIIRLYTMLQQSEKWYSESDVLLFIYNYYGGV